MTPELDEVIKQEIEEQLSWNDSVDGRNINVDVENGFVRLKGKVPGYNHKLVAQNDAYKIAGVRSVENELEVESPPGTPWPEDEEIAGNIESLLQWDDRVKVSELNVEVKDGVTSLSGIVKSYCEKELVEKIAYSFTGVVKVINKLRIKPRVAANDRAIEESIRSALSRNVSIDESAITVDADGGVVRLGGQVPYHAMKQEALDLASFTAGITDIVDEITVR